MSARKCLTGLLALALSLAAAPQASAFANRVFVSARSGNDANNCSSILTPCQTFAGAVLQLNPGGEAIALDSGGYGPVTITQSVTIEAPSGVTAFIHPPSGNGVTVNAGSTDVVTLRGLVLNGGSNAGIVVNTVGTLNVVNCFVTGFAGDGIGMYTAGRLNVKGTNVKACADGVAIFCDAGVVQSAIDHCHLDGNGDGLIAATVFPGSSTTTVSNSTANSNTVNGWAFGNGTSGQDVLNLEFCTGSENAGDGVFAGSGNAMSVARYSNCIFANNGSFGVVQANSSTVESRGSNTITGNTSGATSGTIGSFSPM